MAGGDDLTMMEINEAAKVITDSIDPNAKVIFGAVTDNTLKKGEIKITVIAAGFGEQVPRREKEKIDMRSEPSAVRQEAPISKEQTPTKKMPAFSSQVSQIDNAEEEWDIPAFIRKKMK